MPGQSLSQAPTANGCDHLCCFTELNKWELDSVSVQCLPSTLHYSAGTKVWCRRQDETLCSFVANTDYPSTQPNSKALEDRTLIQDDTQKRTVTITMQKLQAEDSGMYWCALYRSSRLTWLMEVRLSVSKSEYLLAARRGCLQISAPVPLFVLPPILCHSIGAQRCRHTAHTHCSVSLADTLAAAPRACGTKAQAWPFMLCLLPAETQGRFPGAPTNGATLHKCFPQGRSSGSRSSFSSSAPSLPVLGTAGDQSHCQVLLLIWPHNCHPSPVLASQALWAECS